ncbi:amino acid ABC transporter permease [Xanthobacter flavus]|uniref:amino acid ABC transporter permease n=1 Tax=Xanthobacter flavus TaxID=281 RepID=UPI003728DA30
MLSINVGHIEFLLQGALWTIVLSSLAFLCGGIIGALVALARISPLRPVRSLALIYVQVIQGTPLLIVLFLIYFGFPAVAFEVSSLAAAVISMTIYVSAYLGEIWRGAIQSVPKAQWEAAECLALTRIQRMGEVILPQAVKIATPPTVGFLVQIVKNTSLVSVVGFVELSRAAQLINNSIFEPFKIYLIVAVIYFCLCFPLSFWSRRLERNAVHAGAK